MKRVLILGCMIAAFIACNDNNSGNSTPGDSTYNTPSATDTGQGAPPGTTDTSARRSSEDTTRR
jgi:hypothetical protein